MNKQQNDNYHHGDLAQTLMEKALQHIQANGTENLSLRALAREAGVSAAAPYRHFPSKQCLLAALATQGFRSLRNSTLKAIDVDATIEDRLLAMGHAYVEYAIHNPTTYNLMFSSVLGDFSRYADLNQSANDCYAVVLGILDEFIILRKLETTSIELGGAIWTGVHGLASLSINAHTREIDGVNDIDPPQASLMYLQQNPKKILETLFLPLLAT